MTLPVNIKRDIANGNLDQFAKDINAGDLPEPTDHQQNTDTKLLMTGTSGYSGYVYTNNGVSGYWTPAAGLPGDSGYSGYSGQDGVSGYSGLDGLPGDSGYSGYSGQDGLSASGYSGSFIDGASGTVYVLNGLIVGYSGI